MTLELSRVFALRRGNHTEVVGPLAPEGVAYLHATTNIVKLSGEQLRHIDRTHGGISDLEIITIPYGLAHGLLISEVDRPSHLVISFVYPDNGVRYKIAIKVADKGKELWVCTFHKMDKRQTKRLLKRGEIIRRHT